MVDRKKNVHANRIPATQCVHVKCIGLRDGILRLRAIVIVTFMLYIVYDINSPVVQRWTRTINVCCFDFHAPKVNVFTRLFVTFIANVSILLPSVIVIVLLMHTL